MNFTSINSNRIMKCYGKERTTPRTFGSAVAFNDAENLAPDSSPGFKWGISPAEEDLLSSNCSMIVNKKRVQPAEEDAKHNRVRQKVTTVKQQPRNLRDVLLSGHADDLAHLRAQVEDYQQGKMPGMFNVPIAAPSNWTFESKKRFLDWISKLGFGLQSVQSSVFIYSGNVSPASATAAATGVLLPRMVVQTADLERALNASQAAAFVSISQPVNEEPEMTKPRSQSSVDCPPTVESLAMLTRARSQSASTVYERNKDQEIVSGDSADATGSGVFKFGIPLDISGESFRRARFNSCASVISCDSESGSPYPTPRGDSRLYSRPQSRTRFSPVSDNIIHGLDDLNLQRSSTPAGVTATTMSVPRRALSRRNTEVLHDGKLPRIDDVQEEMGSENEKSAIFEDLSSSASTLEGGSEKLAKGLHTDGPDSFICHSREYDPEETSELEVAPLTQVNVAHLVQELEKRGLEVPRGLGSVCSDSSTLVDESFSSTEDDTKGGSKTRKNSTISASFTSSFLAHQSPRRSTPVDSPQTKPLAESAHFDSSHLSTPAPDRLPPMPSLPAAQASGDGGMRAMFDSSQIRSRAKAVGSGCGGGLRKYRTDPGHLLHGDDTPNPPLPTAPRAQPSEGNMFTPQTKQCGDYCWLQSATASNAVIEILRRHLLEALRLDTPSLDCVEGIPTIAEASSFPAPASLIRTKSGPARLSTGSDSGAGFKIFGQTLVNNRESIGSICDEANSSRLLHIMEPSPVKPMAFVVMEHHQSLARAALPSVGTDAMSDNDMMELVLSPARGSQSECREFFGQLSSHTPQPFARGSLSIERSSTSTSSLLDLDPPHLSSQMSPHSDRKQRRKLGYEKRRRMSVARSVQRLPLARQSMAFCQTDISHGGEINVIHDPHLLKTNYTTDVFRRLAVINGGVCSSRFDNLNPVINAPSSAKDARVCDLRFSQNHLHICWLHDGTRRWIDLGTEWRYVRASPCGVLVTNCSPSWHHKVQFYYLHQHPADWTHAFRATTAAVAGSNASLSSSGHHHMNLLYELTANSNNSSALPSVVTEECSMDMSCHGDDEHAVDSLATRQSAGSKVLAQSTLVHRILEHLHSTNLSASFLVVSKQWALSVVRVLSSRVHARMWLAHTPKAADQARLRQFLADHPVGNYVASGACKAVYCVRKKGGSSLSAVSVMNMKDLAEREMADAVLRELDISMACSALAGLGICPNTLRIEKTFRAPHDQHKNVWKNELVHNQTLLSMRDRMFDVSSFGSSFSGGGDSWVSNLFAEVGSPVVKAAKGGTAGSFQFMQMEYCMGGDMESFLARCPQVQDDLQMLRSYMFQMCYSLYCVRESLGMCHYDLKLLNFFLTSPESLLRGGDVRDVLVGFGPQLYALPLQTQRVPRRLASIVKLADFGTSMLGSEHLGQPITLDQFTTLENAAPEMFLLGSSARQSFALDAFPLGLCFFHLLSSPLPYEELLRDVRCPLFLYEQLLRVYHVDDASDPYFIVREVVASLCEDSFVEDASVQQVMARACKDIDSCPYTVVMDTLYRYLVLLNAHLPLGLLENDLYRDNPAYEAIARSLGLDDSCDAPPSLAPRTKRRGPASAVDRRGREHCLQTFRADVRRWSLGTGEEAVMIKTRQRVADLGAGALLESLLHLNPSSRCSMLDALQHPAFGALRAESNPQDSAHAARFLHYYRPPRLANDLPPL